MPLPHSALLTTHRQSRATINARIELGEAPPSPHLFGTQAFTPAFVAHYQTGEITGNLDHVLLALAVDHQATANHRLTAATRLYPALLFGVVALIVAWIALSFAMQYHGQINSLMDGM